LPPKRARSGTTYEAMRALASCERTIGPPWAGRFATFTRATKQNRAFTAWPS